MKNLIKKMELKKFNKLVNNSNIVLFTQGDVIQYAYNKTTKKRYFPRFQMSIVRH